MITTDNTKVNQTLLEENERLKKENIHLLSEINRILRACEKVETAFQNIKKVTR